MQYTYDGLSRLTNAAYSATNRNYTVSYAYDKHGKPTTIQRNGMTTSSSYGLIDNLTATYNGNQIIAVNDVAANIPYAFSHDFKNYTSQATEYTYNQNGAITKDLNRGISQITYNVLNLPSRLDIKSPVGEARNEYVYRSDGSKLRVIHRWNPNFSAAPVIGSGITESALTSTETTDYVGNYVYVNNTLKRILTENGYIENQAYSFYVEDHLESARITADASGLRKQTMGYYPYGMQYGDAISTEVQPYKYTAKEYDQMHGLNLYDSKARFYDPALASFTSMDPLAEKYYAWSPYAYGVNNPLRFTDPTGMFSEDRDKGDNQKNLIDAFSSYIRSLFLIEIDSRSPNTLSESTVRHEQKIQTLENAVETINTVLSALPFYSVAEIGANASEGNYGAALAAVPFVALDLATMGEGKIAYSIKDINRY